jgi:hypothetical protein
VQPLTIEDLNSFGEISGVTRTPIGQANNFYTSNIFLTELMAAPFTPNSNCWID